MLKLSLSALLFFVAFASSALAAEPTWRQDIRPMLESRCLACHGPDAPEYNDWMLMGEERKKVGPRMDTYPHFMSYVVWPATGAMMRRLDNGATGNGKPGNMYEYLGDNDEERSANLRLLQKWIGEGAWNLNRWQQRQDVPGISKEQLEKIRASY